MRRPLHQPLHQAASNQQLVSLANDALRGMEDPLLHRFVGARRLKNGGLLLKMDSEEAAACISGPHIKASFLHRFVPNATFKSRTYSLVVQFMPLHFRPDHVDELHALEELNKLPRMPSCKPSGSNRRTAGLLNRHAGTFSLS